MHYNWWRYMDFWISYAKKSMVNRLEPVQRIEAIKMHCDAHCFLTYLWFADLKLSGFFTKTKFKKPHRIKVIL